ncbi:MAG: peptidase, partial [Cyanobacteria bacterium J06635_13]
SQVQSNNDAQFVRTRQKQASIDGFSLSLEEEEALRNSGHAQETVGWLAIDTGEGNWGDLQYEAGHTGRKVDHRYYNLNFDREFTSEPSLFASLASFYGGDAAGLRYQDLSQTQVQIMVEEDQSLNREMRHTTEVVDFLAIAGTGDFAAIAYEADGLG